VEARLMSVAS